jgi:hypothetical protein
MGAATVDDPATQGRLCNETQESGNLAKGGSRPGSLSYHFWGFRSNAAQGRPSRRGIRGRQGRAALLWGIGLFVLSQLALIGQIAWREPELRDPTFEVKYRQLDRLLSASATPPLKVVFLGSSMTAYDINAGLLDQPLSQAAGRPVVCFNFGLLGGGPISELIYLGRLLQRGVRPDLAVIEVTPRVFNTPSDLPFYQAHRLERSEVPLIQRYSGADGLQRQWWQAFLVPVHGHRLAILNYCVPFLVPHAERIPCWGGMDSHGWVELEVPDPARHARSLEHLRSHVGPGLADYQISTLPQQALTELLDLLTTQSIPTVLLLPPEGPTMRSLYPARTVAALIRHFAEVSEAHHFPFVNAREWLAEEMLCDSFHATSQGARVFTERLGHEVLAPLLHHTRMARSYFGLPAQLADPPDAALFYVKK